MRNQHKKHVVILGAGFGGIACAKALAHSSHELQVTIIDQLPYHTIHGNIYEVASAPEELTDLQELKHSVALPLSEIFSRTGVEVKIGKVKSIDVEKRQVELDHGSVGYDYLVSSLGAKPNFYSITGAEKYSIPLQTPGDALRIRDRVEFLVQAHRLDVNKDMLRVIIAGGGVAGVEIAAELQGMLDFVAWKNSYPRHKIETLIIEGANQLVPGMDSYMARDIQNRLQNIGVRILTHRMITEIEENMVTLNDGEKLEHDCLIWAAGVKAAPLPMTIQPLLARGDRVEVDEYFRVKGAPNVFVIGDQGCHHGPDGSPMPGTASQAIDHAKYVADAIVKISRNQQPAMHTCRQWPIIIPLRGKWAIFKSPNFYIKGYFGYLIREMVWLHYFASILGWWKALQLAMGNERLYTKNDM